MELREPQSPSFLEAKPESEEDGGRGGTPHCRRVTEAGRTRPTPGPSYGVGALTLQSPAARWVEVRALW